MDTSVAGRLAVRTLGVTIAVGCCRAIMERHTGSSQAESHAAPFSHQIDIDEQLF
jgi:hypothetical protein